MYFDDVKVLGGRRLPAHIALVPADAAGQRTEMRYLDVEFDVPLSDETIVIHARRPSEIASALAKRIAGSSSFAGAEVLEWQMLAPEMMTLVRITDVAGLLVLLLVFKVVPH
jgi:hypothetical protein